MALLANGVREVDPISRIEGHLGVKLTVTSSAVSDAKVHGNLWRGFENFLIGRQPNDAITFTQRICGVCPVPHGQASTYAVDAVHGYNQGFQTWVMASEGGEWGGPTGVATASATPDGFGIPLKAVLIRNVVLGAEFLMSHITHLYHLAAPSYVQGPNMPPWTPYFDNSYYHSLLLSDSRALPEQVNGFSKDLWSAVITQYVKALRIRRLTFEAGALFAGRMPMTSCFVAGGVTNDNTADLAAKCAKYADMMSEIGSFVIREFVPLFLALGALYPAYDNKYNNGVADASAAPDTALTGGIGGGGYGFGAGVGNFLSWGGFPQKNGTLEFKRGFMLKATATGATPSSSPINVDDVFANLREDIKYSRYMRSAASAYTGAALAVDVTDPAAEYQTVPVRDDAAKYSWLKAPRWNGAPMEVGPLARMVVGNRYPVNGAALASYGNLAGVYTAYVKTASGNTGINPAMVNADLAVALVREGLATVKIGATTYDQAAIAGASQNTLATVYGDANAVIMGTVRDWIVGLKGGLSIMDRLRGRALEAAFMIVAIRGMFTVGASDISWPAMTTPANCGWIGALKAAPTLGATYSVKSTPTALTTGVGATEAPRGALMHICTIEAGRIKRYQCIVPTTWNASPKDATGAYGPMEKAMIGIPYDDVRSTFTSADSAIVAPVQASGGVEALRVAQSFDPCIACAVH